VTPDQRAVDHAPRAAADELGKEIAVVREELDSLLAELDRRRHEALNLRLQVRRHALGATVTSLAFIGTGAGLVWLGLWRRRRGQRLTVQAGRLRQAVSRMIERPERVAAEPTIPGKILSAAASAAVASLVKKLLERGLQWLLERQGVGAQASERLRREEGRPTPSRGRRPPQ
jgi:hypothetical protein